MSEATYDVQAVIDEIAGAVMMAAPEDLVMLDPVQFRLQQIAAELGGSQPLTARLATLLGQVCERMCGGEVEGEEALETLVRGVSMLQGMHIGFTRNGKEAIDSAELVRELAALAQVEAADLLGEETAAGEGAATEVDAEGFSYFVDEAEEHLGEAERILLVLEENPEDRELLNGIFRAFHTLKGAAAYPNLPEVIEVAHAVENAFDGVRDGSLTLTRGLSDCAFEAIDLLRTQIAAVQSRLDGREGERPHTADFLTRLAGQISAATREKVATPIGPTEAVVFPPVEENEIAAEAAEDSALEFAETEEGAAVVEPSAVEEEIADVEAPAEEEIDQIAEVLLPEEPEEPQSEIDRRLAAVEREAQAVNLNDLSLLAQLEVSLEEAAELFAAGQEKARGLVRNMGNLIELIILEECTDPERALEILAEGSSLLRTLQESFARDGQEPVEEGALIEEIAGLLIGVEEEQPDGEEISDPGLTPEAAIATLGGDGAGSDDPLDDEMEEEEGAEAVSQPTAPAPIPEIASTPIEVDADIFFDFQSEADEHLDTAESTLLALENSPEDAELLNTLFRSFHTIKGASGFLNLVDVTRVAHAVEDVLDSVRKKQLKMSAAITDVVLASIDLLKELLKAVEEQIESGEVRPRDVSDFLTRVAAAAEGKEQAQAAPAQQPAAVAPQETAAEPAASAPAASNGQASKKREQQHVRVDTEKLDMLVNIVGELVIAQTQVAQNPEVLSSTDQKLGKDISQLLKISTDLQEIAMSLRMVPIKATFERMARMVRDLGRKCGKQVEFKMRGEDTELDKNVVEEIVDPLTHMVRNAVDHGVEAAEERRAAGKPERGQVVLEAYHKSGHIVIELRDDGKGINRDRVLQKATDRGLVKPDEELSDREINNLIFHPGLSTAEKISDVSGRGVGMDVVRRNIEQLRGKVEVESEPGKGSIFSIKLPLTLAIIDGMVIGVGGERYILPLTSIISSLRPRPEQISTLLNKGEMIKVQDDLFPLVRLHERCGIEPRYVDPCEGLVMLIESEGERCCLLVDELVGLQQVVIKGLNEELRQDPCLSGCAILGDGRVGLILDASGLVEHARNNRANWDGVPK